MDMLQNGATMMQADVAENQLLYVPWGWLVYEKAANNVEVWGLRWVLVDSWPNKSMGCIAELALPTDRSTVKPNTPVAFLANVIGALETPSQHAPIEPKAVGANKRKVDAIDDPKKAEIEFDDTAKPHKFS